jgi:N-acetylmuramoyl-L-alanine amidase
MKPVLKEKLTVVIDAAHGGQDLGNTEGELSEKDICMAISMRLAELLESSSYRVVQTRSIDEFVSLAERIEAVGGDEDALLISLHLNAERTQTAQGVELYIPSEDHAFHQQSKHFGMQLDQVLDASGEINRGMQTANFYLLKHSPCPVVLVELGFMSSPADLKKLTSPAYQAQLAQYLKQSIDTYAR